MEKEKLLKIVKNVNDTPNKDLLEAANDLYTEFEKTKQLIIDLTRHLDSVEVSYNKVNNELKNIQNDIRLKIRNENGSSRGECLKSYG